MHRHAVSTSVSLGIAVLALLLGAGALMVSARPQIIPIYFPAIANTWTALQTFNSNIQLTNIMSIFKVSTDANPTIQLDGSTSTPAISMGRGGTNPLDFKLFWDSTFGANDLSFQNILAPESVFNIVPPSGSNKVAIQLVRVYDATNFERMQWGTDLNAPNQFEVTIVKGGTGVFRPFVINFAGTNAMKINTNYNVDWRGIFTTYNNIGTKGIGVPAIYAATFAKSETGADASVLSYTPPAAPGTYRVCMVIDTTSGTNGVLGWSMTWHDNNGNVHGPGNMPMTVEGTAAPTLTFTVNGVVVLNACDTIDIDNSQTPIVVKTTLSSGSVAYTISATVEQLQ